MTHKYHTSLFLSLLFMISFLLIPDDVWARAGGRTSSSGAGGILELVAWPIMALYSGIVTYFAVKKNKQARKLLEEIASIDPIWDLDHIKTRVDEAFYKIQHAWRDRNQNIAKDFMSNRLYEEHKIKTDEMLERGIRNEMDRIYLYDSKIVEVLDYKEDSQDSFLALIHGGMIDYIINEQTNEIVDGHKNFSEFKEIWHFKREPHGWVLDEIEPEISIFDILGFKASTEA